MAKEFRVIITRAAELQLPWQEAIEASGFRTESFPLFEVQPVADAAVLAQSIESLWNAQLVVVISPTAAKHLAAHVKLAWPRNVPIAVPGPGTRDALLRAGIEANIICPVRNDDGYDAQALLGAVGAAVNIGQLKIGRALLVRGEQVNEALAEGLQRFGFQITQAVAYTHQPIELTSEKQLQLARLLTSAHQVVWLFSQARAVTHIDALAHTLRPAGMAGHTAVAIHPRIAAAATRAGFHRVITVDPDPKALVTALESLAVSA
jgi:uroporphyrinogen III methyltransferase/synthase